MRSAVVIAAAAVWCLAVGSAGVRAETAPVPTPGRVFLSDQLVPSSSGDSPRACRDLERRAWDRMARRPITEMDVYGSMGDGYFAMAIMSLATLVPNVGMQVGRDALAPALVLSWSASPPFGPVTACRISSSGRNLDELRSLRAVLEPGIVVGSRRSLFVRPGLRAIWHRSSWRVGLGAGIGSTLTWFDGDHAAASLSPELLLHFGRCCLPGYFTLSVRGDRYFPRRESDTVAATLGLTFW